MPEKEARDHEMSVVFSSALIDPLLILY